MVILITWLGVTLTNRNTELSLVRGWEETNIDLSQDFVLLQALLPFTFFISSSFTAHKSQTTTTTVTSEKQCLYLGEKKRVKTGRE